MGYYDDDHDCEPTREEQEEYAGTESTNVKFKGSQMEIKFDAACFMEGIMLEVTSRVKEELYRKIIAEIKKEVLKDMEEKIRLSVHEIVKDIVVDFMENEKIRIGGSSGWDETPEEELTLMQYSKRCIRECIEKGEFNVVIGVEKDRYSGRPRLKTEKYSFEQWLQNGLGIGNDAKAYFNAEIDKIRKQINADVKNAFDESTKTMLSQAVLQVLMANDTYRKIEKNIARIADRADKE